MSYANNPALAHQYVERRNEEFRRDLFDRTVTQRQFQDKHGINQSMVHMLRVAVVPLEQRRRSRHTVTPQMLAAFLTKASNATLAKRFDIPYDTMERMRRRYVGIRQTHELRITESVLFLLRSEFSDRQVAKALGVAHCTVWKLRVKLCIRTPNIRTIITDEQREILADCKTSHEAAKRLQLPVNHVKRWLFLVHEGLL